MFDAAGIVVTEIRTPISAPDFAFVSDRIPAVPATKATKNEKKSGFEMKPVSWCVGGTKSSGARAGRLEDQRGEAGHARSRPGSPTPSAAKDRRARSGLRWTSATDSAASGPNSGPDDHGADDQDRAVEQDADGADLHGEHHERHEAHRQLRVLARALLDLLPHDRVRGQAGRRLLGGVGGVRERGVDVLDGDRADARDVELLEVADDHARLLARDVAEDQVAVGLRGGARGGGRR